MPEESLNPYKEEIVLESLKKDLVINKTPENITKWEWDICNAFMSCVRCVWRSAVY